MVLLCKLVIPDQMVTEAPLAFEAAYANHSFQCIFISSRLHPFTCYFVKGLPHPVNHILQDLSFHTLRKDCALIQLFKVISKNRRYFPYGDYDTVMIELSKYEVGLVEGV